MQETVEYPSKIDVEELADIIDDCVCDLNMRTTDNVGVI